MNHKQVVAVYLEMVLKEVRKRSFSLDVRIAKGQMARTRISTTKLPTNDKLNGKRLCRMTKENDNG